MRIAIVTIFPQLFDGFLQASLINKALARNLIQIEVTDLRKYSPPPHYRVDDIPYGGGPGMVMKPEPLFDAVTALKASYPQARTILMSPAGAVLTQNKAASLSLERELIVVCGRYEGIDQRFIDLVIDEEISIGDYVLMGGEVPAMAVIEACTRLLPGVIGNPDSLACESFGESSLLEAPQYTRPPVFRGKSVPEVLLSGDHAKIDKWRQSQAQELTARRRPELIKKQN
jgi:tRNA (guanine37-N1)-methyltransferase